MPPTDVWAVLADYGALARWATTIDHSCLQTGDGPPTVGTVRRVQVGRLALLERIVDLEVPVRLVYEIDGLPPVVRSCTTTWTLEPDGEGTRIRATVAVDAGPRPPQRLLARLVGRRLARTTAALARDLVAASSPATTAAGDGDQPNSGGGPR